MIRFSSLVLGLALCGAAWAGPDAEDVRDPLIEVHTRQASGPMLGVELVQLTAALRAHFGAGDAGMLVGGVVDGSPAQEAGVAVGDVLVAIGEQPVNELWEARQAVIDAAGGDVTVRVVREGLAQTLTASIAEAEAFDYDGNPFVFEIDDFDDLSEHLDQHDWSVDMDEWFQQDLEHHLDGLSIQLEDMDSRIEQSLEGLELRLQELERQLEERRRKDDFWNGAQ